MREIEAGQLIAQLGKLTCHRKSSTPSTESAHLQQQDLDWQPRNYKMVSEVDKSRLWTFIIDPFLNEHWLLGWQVLTPPRSLLLGDHGG